MSSDRRRAPRIEILGRMHGHVVALGVPVTVREMSLGGLSMETAIAFPAGAVHDFNLTLGDDSSVTLRGRVLYSREAPNSDGEPIFVSGVQFVDIDDEPPADESAVGGLLDKIK